LDEFIRSLDDADRAIFLLFLEKLTYRDISEVVGIEENHLRVKISRMKKRFIEQYIGR
jgi:RNA polymerase sigma-70 factor (ECF subfamily)